jgi:hypothetical protein
MAKLIRELKARFPKARILGHRDLPVVHKACPCYDVSADQKSGVSFDKNSHLPEIRGRPFLKSDGKPEIRDRPTVGVGMILQISD